MAFTTDLPYDTNFVSPWTKSMVLVEGFNICRVEKHYKVIGLDVHVLKVLGYWLYECGSHKFQLLGLKQHGYCVLA